MKQHQEQQHPQAGKDRAIVNSLFQESPDSPSEYNLAELARLRIRYQGFPGARDIQGDLDKILQGWGMTEEELFERTREIHAKGRVYRTRTEQEDWI